MVFEAITAANREHVNRFIAEQWFATVMIVRGESVDLTAVDGVLCMDEGQITGLATYRVAGEVCEILSLDSLRENCGIGSALIERVKEAARANGCRKIVLVTTNDNIRALRFYQRRGFDMARLYRNAIDVSRRLKPEIPLLGEEGIPLRHEIEFEMEL